MDTCASFGAVSCNRLVMEAKKRQGGSGEPKIRKKHSFHNLHIAKNLSCF